jgi:hypothetical protein
MLRNSKHTICHSYRVRDILPSSFLTFSEHIHILFLFQVTFQKQLFKRMQLATRFATNKLTRKIGIHLKLSSEIFFLFEKRDLKENY